MKLLLLKRFGHAKPVRHCFLFFLLCIFLSLSGWSQTTANWIGAVNTNYFDVSNWSNPTIAFNNIASTTLNIMPGVPNNPIHNGGNANSSYRPAKLNTFSGSNFTVNGILYPNGSDSLNGTITINAPADFNIRSGTGTLAHIARNSNAVVNINGGNLSTRNGLNIAVGTVASTATVTVAGGNIWVGGGGSNMDLTLASTTGSTAQLNITGGGVNIARNLIIGTGGKIFISGLGILKISGDKRTQLNGLIASGQLTCAAGKTLEVIYNTATNQTIAQIYVNPNGMLREYADYIELNNGIIYAKIEKITSNILSLKYNGIEQLNQAAGTNRKGTYYDFQTSFFETIYNCVYTVKVENENTVDVSFKRKYNPATGQNTPADADIHYVLNKGDQGLYSYSILEHKPEYPTFNLGSWRMVQWIAQNSTNYLCERIYVDSLRNWQMPSVYDFNNASATGIAEIVKLNTGVRAGKYDGKYEYTSNFWNTRVYGHASNVNGIGTWIIMNNPEYVNGGPAHQDLVAAAGINHVLLNGLHYGDKSFAIPQGEQWSKMYGPFLMYSSGKPTADENWEDAKRRAKEEEAKWPYAWLTNTPEYPLANDRGSISGKFIINDPLKPTVKGGNAWIGVTQLSNSDNEWQHELKNFHHWVKTNTDGTFIIPNIRPGTYTLFAYSDGEVGEYRQESVTVTAGGNNNLGDVNWNIARNNGKLIWEIGTANRRSNEFKMGDFDYCEGFVERKFRDSFPNVIEYNTIEKNWSTKLPYAHTKYPKEDFSPGDIWKWRLNFNLPANLSATGNAKLTIVYASTDHAQQWIYVNDESRTFNTYFPANGDGNAFIRQANYAKYSYKEILIPFSRLRSGANTITLVMPSNSGWVSHHMYDYISLEADIPELSLSTEISNVKCFEGTDGSIKLNFNGGTPPYEVKLGTAGTYSTQASGFSFMNLPAGDTIVFVKDANGVELSANVSITQPALLKLNNTVKDVKCQGGSDGAITVSAEGGKAPYEVKLSADENYTTLVESYTFSNLITGVYTVQLKDANGCVISAEYTVATTNQLPTGALSGSTTICKNSEAKLTITTTGSGTVSGVLSDGTAFSGTAPTITVTVHPSSTTTYTIQTLSDENCTASGEGLQGSATVTVATPATVTIADAKAMNYTGLLLNTVYPEFAPASGINLQAEASNGTGVLSYLWSTGETSTAVTVYPLVTTTYELTVTDALGCITKTTKTIFVKNVGCTNDKISICHIAGNSNHETDICIDATSVIAHLEKGCGLGDCSVEAPALAQQVAEKLFANYNVIILPNPTATSFTAVLQSAETGKVEWKIFDLSGRMIERNVSTGKVLHFGNSYKSGIYILHAVQGNKSSVIRLIKI